MVQRIAPILFRFDLLPERNIVALNFRVVTLYSLNRIEHHTYGRLFRRLPNKKKMEIVGQEKIQLHFKREIDTRWKRLVRKYSNHKGRILFALFLMITELSHSITKETNETDPKNYFRLPMFLLTLDELLIRGWNVLEQPKHDEIQTYVDKVIHEFIQVGYLRNRALESEAFNEEKIVLEYGTELHKLPIQTDEVFLEWASKRFLDEGWNNYYYEKSTIGLKLNETVRKEFLTRYGITIQQLVSFESALAKTAKNQRDGGGNLPLPFIPDKLVTLMIEIMSKVEPVEESVAKFILKELEYNPAKQWSSAPLVKVKIGQNTRYVPLLPSLFINGIISNTWLDHISRGTRGSKSQGMINDDWGKQFEGYVRKILTDHHPNLIVNSGRMKIKKKRFPDIVDCTSNSRPEIDVVAQSEKCVFLISCKAMDHSIALDQLMSFFLKTNKSFSKAIDDDLENARDISRTTECIRQSSDFLKDRGFTDKKIVPLLVTPDQRPLGLASVRQWCLDMKLAYFLPEAKVIRANELKDYSFI